MNKSDSTERFSNRVENYAKYRPSYPVQLLDFMFNELGLSEKSILADMGSGTGLFTHLLLERGSTVYAVEPNLEMRLAAEEALSLYPKFKSLPCVSEQTGIPSSSLDMVCAATAFHWFNAALAKTEWKRILKPSGIALLVWNVRKDASPFLKDYESMLRRFDTEYSSSKHRNVEDDLGISLLFSPGKPRTMIYPNEQIFDFNGLKGRLLSSSYTPVEGHPNHDPMMKELKEIFEKHQQDGLVKFEYESKAYFGSL